MIEFSDPIASETVCCWVIGTYLYRLFDAFPYIGVLGPKGSGKTKLAQIIEVVAFNPIRTDSITPAQLFRCVEVTGGALILDEQEALGSKLQPDDRLSILRGGYKKGGNVLRSQEGPQGYTTQQFDTYGPKVIVNTSGLDDMLADRCLQVHMLKSDGPQGAALVSGQEAELKAVRDELYCQALEVFRGVAQASSDPTFAPDLNNRQRERWLPILSVAQVFCPDRLTDLVAEAAKDTGSTILADSLDTTFLGALDCLVKKPTEELSTSDIGEYMQEILGSERPVTSSKVGKLMRKYLGKNSGRRSGENGSNRYLISRAKVDALLKLYPIN